MRVLTVECAGIVCTETIAVTCHNDIPETWVVARPATGEKEQALFCGAECFADFVNIQIAAVKDLAAQDIKGDFRVGVLVSFAAIQNCDHVGE